MCFHAFRVLEHFNTTAEDYDLIFTSGATAALRLVAEHFDWKAGVTSPSTDIVALSSSAEDTPKHSTEAQPSTQYNWQQHHHHKDEEEEEESLPGAFVYLQENHTSVLGMRGPAHQASCDVFCLTAAEARDWLGEALSNSSLSSAGKANSLLNPACGDPSAGSLGITVKTNYMSGLDCKGSSAFSPESTVKANQLSVSQDPLNGCLESPSKPRGEVKRRNCIFAYSGQCNFSGSKAPLEWIRQVQEGALDGLLSTTPVNKKEAHRSQESGK